MYTHIHNIYVLLCSSIGRLKSKSEKKSPMKQAKGTKAQTFLGRGQKATEMQLSKSLADKRTQTKFFVGHNNSLRIFVAATKQTKIYELVCVCTSNCTWE